MDTFTAIETRRAVKQFDPNHVMTEDEIHKLLGAAILTPTAFNLQHWRFVLVRDPELRREIRRVAWDQPQVTDASLLLVLTGDALAWKKTPERYWANASAEVREMLVGAIDGYYRDREQVQRDEVMRSCGLVGQTIMLAARAMGYDSCPMDGFDYDAVAKLIHLPSDHILGFMVAVGKSTKPAWPRPGQLNLEEVLVTDRFGD